MSTAPASLKRHSLGLPAGSVRAIHVLSIVGLLCALILIPGSKAIPPYLIYLLFLMLGHYFGSHGVSIAKRDDPSPSPLYLPGGTVRLLIVLALLCCVAWKVYSDLEGLTTLFKASLDALKSQPFAPLAILAGFFLGVIVRSFVRDNPPVAWQDMEAWFSLMAIVVLALAGTIHFIDASAALEERLNLPTWEGIVGGVIAFYFGERS